MRTRSTIVRVFLGALKRGEVHPGRPNIASLNLAARGIKSCSRKSQVLIKVPFEFAQREFLNLRTGEIKLIQKIEIDLGNSSDCISRTYKVDSKGNLKLIDTKVIG